MTFLISNQSINDIVIVIIEHRGTNLVVAPYSYDLYGRIFILPYLQDTDLYGFSLKYLDLLVGGLGW